MKIEHFFGVQFLVFCLVAAAFTTIYIPQPVLPVIQEEFNVNEAFASLTVSVVILGIALSNLPFGRIADSYPIKPIILLGGTIVTICGLFCAVTSSLTMMIGTRFIQGLFLPSLTTCLAVYLAQNMPAERLNVVMGLYVSATVTGGLFGRLLGGWIHPQQCWRSAFISASVFLFLSTIAVAGLLPREKKSVVEENSGKGFFSLIRRLDLLRIYFVAFGSYFVFSSMFNYLPFYLARPPFEMSTESIAIIYTTYITGIIISPFAGKLSNRIGNGATMMLGAIIFGLSIGITLIESITVIVISLVGVCAGFFSIHAAAAGLLNRKIDSSRGRANSLYVLFYYIGGSIGITMSGYAYLFFEWTGVVMLGLLMLLLPLITGIIENRQLKPELSEP
ncbi:MAG: MFS transporter [Deltaproteobacteria bacterium]|nr:MFS transporter [Deltaproteobacteria bacterium]